MVAQQLAGMPEEIRTAIAEQETTLKKEALSLVPSRNH